MLLAGIFPAKRTQQKLVECSETPSSIIRTHKNPLPTHYHFAAGFQQKEFAKYYGDVTLNNVPSNQIRQKLLMKEE
jgi:hypothetical protein